MAVGRRCEGLGSHEYARGRPTYSGRLGSISPSNCLDGQSLALSGYFKSARGSDCPLAIVGVQKRTFAGYVLGSDMGTSSRVVARDLGLARSLAYLIAPLVLYFAR